MLYYSLFDGISKEKCPYVQVLFSAIKWLSGTFWKRSSGQAIHCRSPFALQTIKGAIGAKISRTNNTLVFFALHGKSMTDSSRVLP